MTSIRTKAWILSEAAVWLLALRSLAPATGFVVAEGATNGFPIDLPTTLRLAGAQNLEIQVAREKLSEARAQNQSALLRFFPWVSAAAAYNRHDGRIQSTEGVIETVSKQAYAPGGGLVSELDLGEAIYDKLATKQLERAANHALAGQRQSSLLIAVRAYFDLAFAQASIGVAREAVRISTNYEAQMQRAVAAGFALRGELLRVSVEAERNRMAWRHAVEQQRVAGARLAQTLHLDPAVELAAREKDLTPLVLIGTNVPLPSLVQEALTTRPELQQSRALLEAARESKNGTIYGPLVPTLDARIFAGGLGGGRNGDLGNLGDQEDYFVGLGWRIGAGGLLDLGRQRAAQARLNVSRIRVAETRDDVVREVVEAFARLQSESEQINLGRRGLTAAEEGLRLAQQRQDFGVGVVLEHIVAEQDLTRARTDYLKAVTEFNQAQYELSRAVGALPASGD